MSDTTVYTIGELAETTGVTARTIRYYTSEGLLPPPDTRGKYAQYNDDHRNRLGLIARLKDSYLPLSEIKARLDALSPEQIAAIVAEASEAPRQVAETSSAGDYIANVLRTQPFTLSAGSPPQPPMMQAPGAALPSPALPAASAQAPSAPQRTSLLGRLVPQWRAPAEQAASSGEAWHRVELAPGVELHVRDSIDQQLRAKVQALIAQARATLAGQPDDNKG